MSEFSGVAPPLAAALDARGYDAMTPVQNAVLDKGMAGADLLVSAQTGSGKTVAFGMAMADELLGEKARFGKPHAPLALIVAPTRELALQVRQELEWLYGNTGASFATCVGGMDVRSERRALAAGAHIVVGTPGRLRDHITRKALDLSQLRSIVLDEADEMLNLGFREDLQFILDATPDERRTLMFSATVPPQIAKLAQRYQRDAVRVTVESGRKQHVDIEYMALVTAPRQQEVAIANLLLYHEPANALVFCNTRAAVARMASRLTNRGFAVVALSGELNQNQRSHALQSLRDGRAQICVATDVAARGIDLPQLELVVHAELPTSPETLLHRSGRTGRAGRKGISALMVDDKARGRAQRLLQNAGIQAKWDNAPSADAVRERSDARLLAASQLTDKADEDERDFARRLLDQYAPEQIAIAYLRLAREGKGAPEELSVVSVDQPAHRRRDAPEPQRKSAERNRQQDFERSVWVQLSVGRKQHAEPRWLIPLLCNAGEMTKRDIGFIRIEPAHTVVELDADSAEKLVAMAADNAVLEKNIRVKLLEGRPEFGEGGSGQGEAPFKRGGKKPFKRDAEGGKPHKSAKFSHAKNGGAKKGGAKQGEARKAEGGKGDAKRPQGGRPDRKSGGAASARDPGARKGAPRSGGARAGAPRKTGAGAGKAPAGKKR